MSVFTPPPLPPLPSLSSSINGGAVSVISEIGRFNSLASTKLSVVFDSVCVGVIQSVML